MRAAEWADIEFRSGLTRSDLETIAAAYAKSNATIVSYGMGVTQHCWAHRTCNSSPTCCCCAGNIGKPGAGICPLRGHSNVQGDRTVGISEKPGAAMLENIQRTFGFEPPSAHGHDAVARMAAMLAGRSKVLSASAAISPWPCRIRTSFKAMRNLDLAVHIATKLNRSHLLIGKDSIILPCLGRTEEDVQATGPQSVTVEDSMSMVHASRGKLPPASGYLLSEPAIVAGIARATIPDSKVPWEDLVDDYDKIRDCIESVFRTSRIITSGFGIPAASACRCTPRSESGRPLQAGRNSCCPRHRSPTQVPWFSRPFAVTTNTTHHLRER